MFVPSVCLSIRMEWLDSHWKDLLDNMYCFTTIYLPCSSLFKIRYKFLFHPVGMRTPEVIKASDQYFFQQPCRCSTSLNASPYPVVILTVHIFFHTVTSRRWKAAIVILRCNLTFLSFTSSYFSLYGVLVSFRVMAFPLPGFPHRWTFTM
jgi:hypothetical protein